MDREKMQAELVQKLQDMGKQEAHDAKVYAQGGPGWHSKGR